MEKRERKTTPIGEAKWAHLHQPKKAFDEKGEPKYQIDVVFSTDHPEWKALANAIIATLKDKKLKTSPIKKEVNENDEPTGRYYVTFKTSAKFKPQVFDKQGQLIPDTIKVGNGSMVRVSYMENEFAGFGGGINFYLNAVQVVNLIEHKSQNAEAYGFEVEEVQETSELEAF